MIAALLSDLRLASRVLRRQPAVTALLLVMLALGVAANVTVFSLANGLFLRPLPFPEADRLVYLNETAPRWNLEFTGINYPDFHRWREGSRAFAGLALYGRGSYNLADAGGSERVEGAMATHDLLAVLGLVPALGRGFTPEEDRPGGPPVLMLGYDTWRSRFGGDPSVLGRPVRLDGVSRVIVGVLPPEAIFPSRAAVWVPVAGDPDDSSNNYWADGVARLNPGVTLEAARQDLLRALEPLYETRDKERQVAPRLMPLRERYVGDFRATTVALGLGVALVLLVACANVAGSSLARACARQKEVGVRIALGAGLGQLARQLLAESLLLSAVGSLAGLVLGQWACRLLVSVLPDRFPAWVRFDVDARVLAFSALVALVTSILFGWAPLVDVRRTDVRAALAEGAVRGVTRRSRRTLGALVAVEVALATLLLVGGGLLVRAFDRLRNVDPGYSVDGALSFRLALPVSRYPEGPAPVAFYEGLLEELRALPGVDAAGAVSCPPLGCHWGRFLDVEGEAPRAPGAPNPVVLTQIATEQYLEAMKTGIVAGRSFARGDGRAGSGPVVIVNQTLARRIAAEGTAVGRRVRFGEKGPWLDVIGVVRDVRHDGLEAPVHPGAYLPLRQESTGSLTVVLRTEADPQAVFAAVRQVVQRLDPELPLFEVARLREALEQSLAVRRAFSWLSLVFSAVALVLATGGVYGIVSYGAARRTREMGIRVVLGASRREVLRLLAGHGLRPACVGLAFGLVAALGMSRVLASLLAGLSPLDPPTFATAAALLLGTALVAALLPARRVASLSPQIALREE